MSERSPSLTRKQFLKAAALTALLPLLPRIKAAEARAIGVTEVASGIFVHRGKYEEVTPENAGNISNMTIIVGAEAAAIIDTGTSSHLGQSLREAAAAITPLPVRYVINTHMHPDHVLGNAAFKDLKPEFIAHHKMARALAVRAKGYLANYEARMGAENFTGTEIVLPTRSITNNAELDLGGRKLHLKPRATAHTDNDLTVEDSATGIMLVGDLIFSKRIPTIDGSIIGWLKLLDQFGTEDFTSLIPGHGPTVMKKADAIPPIKQYLATIAKEVRAAIKAGTTLPNAVKTIGLSEKDKWLLFDQNHRRNVTAAYAELEWE